MNYSLPSYTETIVNVTLQRDSSSLRMSECNTTTDSSRLRKCVCNATTERKTISCHIVSSADIINYSCEVGFEVSNLSTDCTRNIGYIQINLQLFYDIYLKMKSGFLTNGV